jgi:hypothetical protein
MKNEKSPVLDSFTIEFYNFFWEDFNPFLIRSFNQGYDNGYMSISQRHEVITCLLKEGKSKFYL